MGGNGVLLYHVARHLSDMEIVYTYEGTDTIQSLIVGRDVTALRVRIDACQPVSTPGRRLLLLALQPIS